MRGLVPIIAFAVVASGAVVGLLSLKRDAAAQGMRADLVEDTDRAGTVELGRAQALGRRLTLADPNDREAAARWAFASAALAADFGVETGRETAEALTHLDATTSPEEASVIATAARALDRLHAGDREGAARWAGTAAGLGTELPHPLYALGRTRARSGDLPGAARALEAAIIRAPGFSAARIAWAEVKLDLGDAKTARETLRALLAQAPNDPRVALLLNEAEAALGAPATPLPFAADCPAHKWLPRAVVAACTLGRAQRARGDGARAEARTLAEAAAGTAPDEPRLLARIAVALAELGAVDRAAALLERARRRMAAEAPALAWASAAVSFARGRAAALPAGPRPANPDVRLLAIRASLAVGGVGALSSALDEVGAGAQARDADLAELARLRRRDEGRRGGRPGDEGPRPAPPAGGGGGPVRAYVEGLAARLEGNLSLAIERLGQALSGHGDACRAAGEYRATLRALKRTADAGAFRALRGENGGCANLPRM